MKKNIYRFIVFVFANALVFASVGYFINLSNYDLYASPRHTGHKRPARSGSVKKRSARSGSTVKKPTVKTGIGQKSSARSGSMSMRRGVRSTGRSGSLVGSPSSAKTPESANSNQNVKTTPPDKFASVSGDKKVSMCMYAYVNCMDAMIGYVLKKNPYLDTDKAVSDMISKDKPFRCVFATGNYDKNDEVSIKGGRIEYINENSESEKNNNAIPELAGMFSGSSSAQQPSISDWAANALYKKYNYFCTEKDNTICEYDFSANNKYFASKQSTAYYMDIYSRIKGGCSNGSVEWSNEEDGEDEGELSNSCKSTEGRWYKPNSLKMTDMNNDLMSELGFSSTSGGRCFSSENRDACIASGRKWEVNKCLIEAAETKEQCEDPKMFNATWEKKKEWSFAVNVPPPSMTLNSGEEFGIASNMCFVGATEDKIIKSKRLQTFRNNLKMKGIPNKVIDSIVEPQNGDNAGFVDVLSKCGDYRENLEDYYQNGVWPEKGEDQADPKAKKKLDEFFVTAPKSCSQYELSLKSVRQTWKGKTTEAITENARELERKMKTEEVKDLKADLNVNLQVAQMSNEIYKQCLGEFKSCVNKNCGKNYGKCVSTNGLNKSIMTDVGLLCYPGYKICMDTTSKTLDTSQMSPQLRKIVMEMDATKMSEMAMDSLKEALKEEYNKIMGKSCADAGGYFYAGMCGIMFVDIQSSSTESVNEIMMTIVEQAGGFIEDPNCSNKDKKKGKCHMIEQEKKTKKETQKVGNTKSSEKKKSGIALPGVSFKYNKSSAKNTASGGSRSGEDVTTSVRCELNGKSEFADSRVADGNGIETGSGEGDVESWDAKAKSTCEITEDVAVVMQDKDGEVVTKLASKGIAPFIPAGWSNIVEQSHLGEKNDQTCFASNKMKMSSSTEDPLSLLLKDLKLTEEKSKRTGAVINRCTPKGYMDHEVEQMFENDWKKVFKSIKG